MRKLIQIVCLLSFFSIITNLHAQKLHREDGYLTTELEHTFNVEKTGKFSARVTNGKFTITGWNKNQVYIKEVLKLEVYTDQEAERIIERVKASYEQIGPNVSIERSVSGGVRRVFQISVPTEYDIKIQTSGGDINIDNVKGMFDLKTSGGDIELKNLGGELSVVTSGGDLLFDLIDGEIDAHSSGGDIELRKITGYVDASTAGGDVVLRDAKKNAKLHTSGGDVEAYQIGGDLDAHTSGGSIHIEDCDKSVNAHTSGGDIFIGTIKGDAIVKTSGGDIEGRSLYGTVNAFTSGGDIEIRDLQGPIEARTSGGGIEIELTLTDFSKPHWMKLSSSGGDLGIVIPAKLPANILAEIKLNRSRRYWNRNEIYTDFPLTKTSDGEGERYVLRSEGKINGGGDEIYLSTSNGSISIKKAQ